MNWRSAVFWAACLAAASPPGWGLGLKTRFADVTVDHLKIGKTYSMNDLLNFPLRIVNTSQEPVDLLVQVVRPNPDEVVKGYEAIPDTRWVRLQKNRFTAVAPGQEAVTDVLLSLPLDDRLLGRRFQVWLWTRTMTKGTVGVGLKSRLRLSVSSARPSDEELKEKFVAKRLANVNFSLAPMEFGPVQGAALGRSVELDKDVGAKLKLVNPNDEALDFRLRSVGVWETPLGLTPGFEAPPDPKWLTLATKGAPKPADSAVVRASGDSIVPVKLFLSVPNEPRYRGRRWMFVIRAEVLEQEIPAYAYVRVYVTTAEGGKGKP